jgi:hypothetical protein
VTLPSRAVEVGDESHLDPITTACEYDSYVSVTASAAKAEAGVPVAIRTLSGSCTRSAARAGQLIEMALCPAIVDRLHYDPRCSRVRSGPGGTRRLPPQTLPVR